ncbi:hypothetical protein [Psychrosphaera algicola]|uniref:Uncharacterized protein n=1 Tax=Psychrosphaera algicola TaxID=3023714 RepID=A0ABT5FDU4_9GAMM|nr:hypothetical protein [Psychrosphaera sp. G1-22]MDC2889720.1 hypothetical protein [Psychrosphaera sp. G1-22]
MLRSQIDRLHQYAGHWVSSDNIETDSFGAFPAIKMKNISTMNNQSMQVEVLQYQNGHYKTLLTELIGYDTKSDQIIALGQNQEGVIFKGKGLFHRIKNGRCETSICLVTFICKSILSFKAPAIY